MGPAQMIVRNVTVPTLTVFPAKGGNPSKTAVIVAPGGGFRILSIDIEGYQVADWFSQRGITTFVLKYRVEETPASNEEFMPSKLPPGVPDPFMKRVMMPLAEGVERNAIADGLQAIKLLRENAAKWGISPDRVLFMGFSAGAALTGGTMLAQDAAARPNYAGLIYGAPLNDPTAIPANTPPAFFAVAEDDPLASGHALKFFGALRDANARPELHVFRAGGHGFSMNRHNASTDRWIDELYWWMESQGLTKP